MASFRFPIRRFLQGIDRVERPPSQFGLPQWVISRALYRFKKFDLSQVPPAERSRALQLELTQAAPFRNSAHYIGWQNGRALVWTWDEDRIGQAVRTGKLNANRLRILPETLLHSPVQEGLRLVRCIDGFEGQFWQQSMLEQSRWWPHMPSAEEWLMFQRDCSLAPEKQQAAPPAADSMALGRQPWLGVSSLEVSAIEPGERLALACAAMLLLVPSLWYGAGLYKLEKRAQEHEATLEMLREQAEPISMARGQALDYLARIRELEAIRPHPEQLVVLSRLAESLPNDGSFIRLWDFQGGKLKIVLASTGDIAAAPLIDALQKAGVFLNVTAQSGTASNVLALQMEVAAR